MPNCGLALYGTRPEAIKMAPVVEALQHNDFLMKVVNTGQHQELMPTIMPLFGVTVDENLAVLSPGQSLAELTEKLLHAVTNVLEHYRPDFVIVQGDTTTAFVGALAAFYRHIPVAHVEAGLRTFDLNSPFPEEASRRMIAALTTWNFCPSPGTAATLRQERVPGAVDVTGNPIVDALYRIRQENRPPVPSKTKRVIATVHRRENFDRLRDIFMALDHIASLPDVEVILPVHANPAIQRAADQYLPGSPVRTIAPMDYVPWIQLLSSADLVITDSGGLQEEAPILGIPLLVVRDSTERVEVIDQGYGYLVGTTTKDIIQYAHDALAGTLPFRTGSPYGDGTASHHIANILRSAYGPTKRGCESHHTFPEDTAVAPAVP